MVDTAKKSEQYRTTEPVQIKLIESKVESDLSEQFVELKETEWVVYNFNNLEGRKYEFTMKAAADNIPAKGIIQINDQKFDFTVIDKNWAEVTLGDYYLKAGENKLQIQIISNALKIDWICFK